VADDRDVQQDGARSHAGHTPRERGRERQRRGARPNGARRPILTVLEEDVLVLLEGLLQVVLGDDEDVVVELDLGVRRSEEEAGPDGNQQCELHPWLARGQMADGRRAHRAYTCAALPESIHDRTSRGYRIREGESLPRPRGTDSRWELRRRAVLTASGGAGDGGSDGGGCGGGGGGGGDRRGAGDEAGTHRRGDGGGGQVARHRYCHVTGD
jgi:uncharacterized membrane protein YgcG